jgi:hypothetical protein
MTSKNETKLGYVIAVVCLVVGVLLYGTLPAEPPETPVRLMFQSAAGKVLFDHQIHMDRYGLSCSDCHHADENDSALPVSCSDCHQIEAEYVPALGAGGKFNHDAHSMDFGFDCADCHHMGTEGASHCGDCHQRGVDDEYMPGRTQAFHGQCIGCHEDMGLTPGAGDCAGCHIPRKRAEAFHDQCMGCHENFGAGPAMDDCATCHGYGN